MSFARRGVYAEYVRTLSAAELQAWHTTPLEIAPAPGPNRVIMPHSVFYEYKYGTHPFSAASTNEADRGWKLSQDATLAYYYYQDQGEHGLITAWRATQPVCWGSGLYVSGDPDTTVEAVPLATLANLPILIVGVADLVGGSIATSSKNDGGSGYAALDTGHVIQGSNAGATFRVDTVDGGGAVLTYTITGAGAGYVPENALATDTNGIGTGFKVNILTVNKGDGSLITTVDYNIIQLY